MANITKMNKATLAEHGKSLGVKLDDGMTKKTMVDLIRQHNTNSSNADKIWGTKKKEVIVGKPVTTPSKVPAPKVQPKDKSIWQTVKDFFGVQYESS